MGALPDRGRPPLTKATRVRRRIERAVSKYIQQHAMIAPGERVLLAVSGGPDSCALLWIMAALRERTGGRLTVAYVDHGVRPADEIEAERRFVAEQVHAAGCEFVSSSITPGGGASEGAMREGRYRTLAALAAETGSTVVATGHTRDDQAETVLLRLLRGSGLSGLAGMAAVAPWPVESERLLRLLRPLLGLSRAETVAYCAAVGVEPRSDPTNSDRRYRRNRVRHDLLPLMRSMNPNITDTLVALADESAGWRAECDVALVPLIEERLRINDERHVTADLSGLDGALRTELIRAVLGAALPDEPAPSRIHTRAIERLVRQGRGAARLDADLEARVEGASLVVGPLRPSVEQPPALPDVPLPNVGSLMWGGWRVEVCALEAPAEPAAGDRWTLVVAAAEVGRLTVGPRWPGELIEVAGMRGRKRLQDLFVDEKVPAAERQTWPVIRAVRGVLWVPGLRAAGWAASHRPDRQIRVIGPPDR